MKILARVLFVFIFATAFCNDATSLEILFNTISDDNYILEEDTTVANGVSLEAHDIQITNTIKITNLGTISGGVNICSGCTLGLQNTGVFNASVTLQDGAHVVQSITQNSEITDIGLNSGFDVIVSDGVGLNMHQVMQVASSADSVEIINTHFDAGAIADYLAPSNVVLHGDIFLRFDDVTNQTILLFSNVSGDGAVYVDSYVQNALYAFETYSDNHDIFVRLVRSTDYARILNNDMGRFLNDLRATGRDDKLFAKLDSAKTMGEINGILSRSVRTNPIKLMRPVSLMNSYKMLEIMHIDDGIVFGIEPLSIYSADVFMYGVRPNVAFNVINDLHLKLSGYVMNIDYADDVNEYNGISFGGDADAQYDMSNNNFARMHIGGGKSYFDIGPVFAGGVVVNRPDGTHLYTIGDFGHMFSLGGGYTLSPFAGVGTEYIAITKADDMIVYGLGGMDIGYEYKFDGLRYNYTGRVIARTDGTYGAGINLSAWSVFDEAGADMYIGTIYNSDFGMSLKFALNGRFRF